MLKDALLEEYINGFYGYGSYDAKYWFIGTEEGIRKPKDPNKKLEDKIRKKLNMWHDLGGQELLDLRLFHLALDPNDDRFAEHAKLDVVAWRAVIHVLLCIGGEKPKKRTVREYQSNKLARKAGTESSLLELLPLPSPGLRRWLELYVKHSSALPFLESRPKYVDHVMPDRVKQLRAQIEKNKPKLVLFYGMSYRKYQKKIAQVEFTRRYGVEIGRNDHTLFIITKHPNEPGVTNDYFDRTGKMIRKELERP